MKRRGHNEGSIYKRADGRWASVLDLGYENGKRRRKTFYGKTRREVQEQLTAASRDQQRGIFMAVPQRLTVGQFLTRWLKDSVHPSVRESTYVGYEVQVRRHIVPALGDTPLAKLQPQHLQSYYRAQLDSGLSPRTVQFQHRILHLALGKAVRWGSAARNIAELVDAPRVPAKMMKALNPTQAKAFLEAVGQDRLEALYVLTLCTGLRRGEVLALSWNDMDLDNGTLAVRQTLVKVKGGWSLSEPKTAGSRRVVRLPSVALNALRRHRVRQLQERLLAGSRWQETGLVFTTSIGSLIDGNNLLRAFQRHLQRLGLPVMPFHGLRHSAATLMLALGIQPKVVAEMLGHSRIGITMDIYSHVLPDLQHEAALKMDGLLTGTG